jgi:hypothetical protein
MILTSEKLYMRYKNPAQDIDKNLRVNYLEPDPRYALRLPQVQPDPFPSPSPAMYNLGLSLLLPPPPPTPDDELNEKDTRVRQTVAAIPSPEKEAGGPEEENTNGLARTPTIIFHPEASEDTGEAPPLTRTVTAIYDPDGAPGGSRGPSDVPLTRSDTVLHRREPSSLDTVPTRGEAEISCPLPSTSESAARRPHSAAGIRSPEHAPPPMRPTTSHTGSPRPWTGELVGSPTRKWSSPQIEEMPVRWEWPAVESGPSTPSERSPWLEFLIPALTYNTPSCMAGDLAVSYQCVRRDAELQERAVLDVGIWGQHSHCGVGV